MMKADVKCMTQSLNLVSLISLNVTIVKGSRRCITGWQSLLSNSVGPTQAILDTGKEAQVCTAQQFGIPDLQGQLFQVCKASNPRFMQLDGCTSN